jgi:hypothetical protein
LGDGWCKIVTQWSDEPEVLFDLGDPEYHDF